MHMYESSGTCSYRRSIQTDKKTCTWREAGERKCVVDHKLLHPSWHQRSIISLLHKNSFPLTSMHSLSPTATGASSTALAVCSFPKALSLLAASSSTHPTHHLYAHERMYLRPPVLADRLYEWAVISSSGTDGKHSSQMLACSLR